MGVIDRTVTLALVHGGTQTSTAWDGVRAHLHTPALAVDLPGRRHRPADLGSITRQDWVDAVCNDIVAHDLHDVVLVGHSSGGYVIPGVAAQMAARVRQLVFVNATVPSDGTRPVDFLKPKLREMTIASEDFLRRAAQGKTIGGLRDGEAAIETDLEIVENPPTMGLEAPAPLFEPFTWNGVPSRDVLPRTFIRGMRDRVIPPDLALVMVDNMGGADVIDLDAGHDSPAEVPAELAAMLDAIATSALATH